MSIFFNLPQIPDVSKEQLIAAMELFDDDLRSIDEWKNWTDKRNFKYAIFLDYKLYPVKTIVSLATGVPVEVFSGGDQANGYVIKKGFQVITLRSYSWKIESGTIAKKNLDKSAFLHRGTGIPNEIRPFFIVGELIQGEKRLITMVHEGKNYSAHIDMEGQDTERTRLFWNAEFSKLLRTRYASLYEIYNADDEPTENIALIFERLSDCQRRPDIVLNMAV